MGTVTCTDHLTTGDDANGLVVMVITIQDSYAGNTIPLVVCEGGARAFPKGRIRYLVNDTGKVVRPETPHEALRRELWHETGLQLDHATQVVAYDELLVRLGGELVPMYFYALTFEGPVALNTETDETDYVEAVLEVPIGQIRRHAFHPWYKQLLSWAAPDLYEEIFG